MTTYTKTIHMHLSRSDLGGQRDHFPQVVSEWIGNKFAEIKNKVEFLANEDGENLTLSISYQSNSVEMDNKDNAIANFLYEPENMSRMAPNPQWVTVGIWLQSNLTSVETFPSYAGVGKKYKMRGFKGDIDEVLDKSTGVRLEFRMRKMNIESTLRIQDLITRWTGLNVTVAENGKYTALTIAQENGLPYPNLGDVKESIFELVKPFESTKLCGNLHWEEYMEWFLVKVVAFHVHARGGDYEAKASLEEKVNYLISASFQTSGAKHRF